MKERYREIKEKKVKDRRKERVANKQKKVKQ